MSMNWRLFCYLEHEVERFGRLDEFDAGELAAHRFLHRLVVELHGINFLGKVRGRSLDADRIADSEFAEFQLDGSK